MAEQTLLEMTQDVLSSLDSDEVNSISDTTESLQVATIIKNKYYDILTRGDLPAQEVLLQLTASGDATLPTLMYIPDGVTKIDWIKYFDSNPADSQNVSQFGSYSHGVNTDIITSTTWATTSLTSNTIGLGTKTFTVASSSLNITIGQGAMAIAGTSSMFGTVVSYVSTTLVLNVTSSIGTGTFSAWNIASSDAQSVPGYKYVTGLPIDDFLDMINRFNPADSTVSSFTFTEGSNSFTFYYKNASQPSYYTVIENHYVIFDSYDVNFDDTLQSSKTLVLAEQVTPFQMVDSFVPDMDDNQFPLLLNEAKALAYFELKQMPHIKAEQEIKRQWSAVQKTKAKSNKPSHFDQLANFGRVPRTGGYSSGGYGAYKWMRGGGGK